MSGWKTNQSSRDHQKKKNAGFATRLGKRNDFGAIITIFCFDDRAMLNFFLGDDRAEDQVVPWQ